LKGLDAALAARRSVRVLGGDLPSRRALGHLLHFAHGVHAPPARGPTPSAGDLQALELYAAVWSEGWLPRGVYHYDRAAHRLAQLHAGAARAEWSALAPSMEHVEGGALLWIIAGDAGRAMAKYGERGERFLLLEAGHLMQSLCLLSTSLGLAAVPLGGVFEAAIAARLRLLDDDIVLYAAAAGVRA
jgi:SagB-type dehydrogenase family enzyme